MSDKTLHEAIAYPFPEPPARGEAVVVAEGVLWMRLPLPMKLDHVNVYAFDDGSEGWTVVDTGFNTSLTRDIWETLLAGPLGGRRVHRVLVTHHHPDHIGLAGWFQNSGARLLTSRTAWLTARMLQLDEQALPTEETLAFWRSAGIDEEVLAQRAGERPFNFADVVAPMPLGYQRVQQGDRLHLGGRNWQVHMGNGHAPEHITLWSEEDGLVVAGDQILPSISPNIGVYATEPEADPLGEWLEACERLARLAREDHLVLGGHKLPFTGLPHRMHNLIENHHSALDRLRSHLSQPASAGACFPPLFRRPIREAEYGLALVEAVAHVQHLWHSGEASRVKSPEGAWLYQMREERIQDG